jgi:hypothetical protein
MARFMKKDLLFSENRVANIGLPRCCSSLMLCRAEKWVLGCVIAEESYDFEQYLHCHRLSSKNP